MLNRLNRLFSASAETGSKPPVPPDEVLQLAGIGGGDYSAVGRDFLQYFKDLAGLKPTDSVLEIGCGVGRMAVALTTWLQLSGRYEGFDIVPSSVHWCQNHVTPRYPHFRFQCVDVNNTLYNPSGQLKAEELRFPFDGRSFDVVIATSVFTHLLPATALRYLAESRRVLRPEGRLFATWFLWRPGFESFDEATKLFPFDSGLYRVGSRENPEAVVAFDEAYVRDAYRSAGFRLTSDTAGNWARGEHALPYQDMLVGQAH